MTHRQILKKINASTFHSQPSDKTIETVIGDEKQAEFLPRVKIKKWNNEVNFSVGTKHTTGTHGVKNNTVSFESGNETARFYPINPEQPEFDMSSIRLIRLGGITPERIGSIYELDRHIYWGKQTIVVHHCDRLAMMYYGFYPSTAYIDRSKMDIPEMRISSYPLQNDPMVMDPTLKLIDIHYNPRRDDLEKIQTATKQSIISVLKKYNIEATGERKLYFEHNGKKVKFFSAAFIGGHYYYYINLGLEYQLAHKYFRDDVIPPTTDFAAYGLRSLNPDIPDSIIDEILEEYAKQYGLNLTIDSFTNEESAILEKLDTEHLDTEWIYNAKRNIFDITAKGFDHMGEGFEFEIELKEKPSSNIIPLSVETKGLNFYYQGELGDDESRNTMRPPNVIGSYAAYHKNESNGKYETGKAFHIYRPWAVDNTGIKVWCTFDPDWNGEGDLNITVPQDFLDSATFPVIIDPTFGYTTQGSSSTGTEGIYGIPATTTAGTLDYISAYAIASYSGKCAIYDNTTKLADSIENTASKNGWVAMPVSASMSAQSYNITFWLKTGGYNAISYDTVSNAGLFSSTTYVSGDNNFPSSVSFTTTNSKYSIYASYTETGATSGMRVWDGTDWILKPVKVWNGSSWTQKPPKRWNGSSWVTIDN